MKLKFLKTSSLALASMLLLANSAWAGSVATASASGSYINFSPSVSSAILLEVTNGFEFAYREVFADGAPSFSTTQGDTTLADGQYTYQLTGSVDDSGAIVRQSGTFEITGGNITLGYSGAEE